MNTINEFTRANVADLHNEMEAALKPLAEKYGIAIVRAGGSLGGIKTTLKFELKVTSADGERVQFEKDCAAFACKPSDYARVATINGKEVTLVGFEFRRSKFPIRCRHKDGKVMLYTEDVLKRYFHTGVRELPTEVPAPSKGGQA